jgi:hypothetical protein
MQHLHYAPRPEDAALVAEASGLIDPSDPASPAAQI